MLRHFVALLFAATVVAGTPAYADVDLLPNGGFEWIENLEEGWAKQKAAQGFELGGKVPVLPVTWHLEQPGRFIVLSDPGAARSGKNAFLVESKTGTSVSVGWIEVEPRSTYNLSLWARGNGQVRAEYEKAVPESAFVGHRVESLGMVRSREKWTVFRHSG